MNLRLRPMTEDEIARWIETGPEDYARQRAQVGESEATARQAARDQYAIYFPGGTPAARHQLMILEHDGARIGMIWVGPHPRRPDAAEAAWLYNLEIDERHRGRGFGRAGLALTEAELSRCGITEFGLNVFAKNNTARQLYATAGFREVSTTMTKELTPSNDPAR